MPLMILPFEAARQMITGAGERTFASGDLYRCRKGPCQVEEERQFYHGQCPRRDPGFFVCYPRRKRAAGRNFKEDTLSSARIGKDCRVIIGR